MFKFKKEQTMKLSEYFELKNPKYCTLQIIPHSFNRNYDTEILVQTISSIYKLPYQRLKKEIKENKSFKFTFELPEKASFILSISKDDCKFYLVVPERYKKLFIEKCTDAWNKSTINEVNTLINLEGEKYELHYKKEDPLSLKVNKKTNEPLSNILSVKDIMEDDDKINIVYNFIPISQNRWKGIYKETIKHINSGIPIDKEKYTLSFFIRMLFIGLIKGIDFSFDLLNDFFGDGNSNANNEAAITRTYTSDELSKNTKKKENATVVGTQIIVNSNSIDKTRQCNNAISVCESYKVINEDNALVYKKINKDIPINIEKHIIDKIAINKMSTLECNNLIQIPGRDLLDKYKIKSKVQVLENPIPEELKNGNISIGESKCKGNKQEAFLPKEYNFANLALLLLSPQGGGKTTLIGNIVNNANKAKESNIVMDYIKNCELAESIKKVVNPSDIIDIDLSKEECFQSLSFNEINYNGTSEFEMFRVANLKAEQTLAFIDAANNEGIALTGKMRRYLSAAANIVYLHNNTSIGDVIKCLNKYQKRIEYVNWARKNISKQGLEYIEDMLDSLDELNEVEKEIDRKTKEVLRCDIVGTKDSKIEGILDRVNLIQENIYLKYMLNMKSDNNINFIKAMEEGKTILIKMPEDKFNNTMVKNVLITFFTSKIILATKLRGALHEEPSRCNVFYDEIYQAPTAEGIICNVLSQLRKFGTKIIISAHYMDQLSNKLKNEIKASGSSYMLLQGADKKNFDELKEELFPYELEDLLKLEQFNSLNLIRYKNGYAKFITKLPEPIGK
ncbi:hypothetical protein [Clostridium botulinum]|uniref:AAA-like domain protein n=1 Tax=Clostridium botulinum TaxID=1491 RepID=A0A6B4JNR7_CLOBO|nr:hypothetical protein [Clostridium botulinum]EES50523.1 conserved hypothetical protein [Clostridium botulinum E1 str. 'BoNT E Beluga']MBY6761834.1 hypothetical protein [Clostridium botulinum]MBY6920760.1 hypothetical protein [Clostridium botulinum]MBY6932228.1 hypothetical protein [Clostridium botulinum]MCR1131492.1 hypothetical protein [Clostridium botulinum]